MISQLCGGERGAKDWNSLSSSLSFFEICCTTTFDIFHVNNQVLDNECLPGESENIIAVFQ